MLNLSGKFFYSWNGKKFIFSIFKVGDGPKTFSHQLVMQYFEVYYALL